MDSKISIQEHLIQINLRQHPEHLKQEHMALQKLYVSCIQLWVMCSHARPIK